MRRNRVFTIATVAAAAAGLAAIPAGAGEGALTAELSSGGDAKRGGLVLDVTGTTGADRLTLKTPGGDAVASVPSPQTINCPPTSPMDPTCTPGCTQDSAQQFTCDASLGISALRAFMGPGGDKVRAPKARKLTNQYGGSGNDTLIGGKKFDFLNGQGGGNDKCKGKKGPETIKKCE